MRKTMVPAVLLLGLMVPVAPAAADCSAVPFGTVAVTPSETFDPSGKPVEVVIDGRFIQPDGCTFRFARFSVVDEYRELTLAGPMPLDDNGAFRKTITLEAKPDGRDFDGRKFVINVTAVNEAGTGNARDELVFEHDPHHAGMTGKP